MIIGYRPVFIQSERNDIDSAIGEVKKFGNATLWGKPTYFVHFDYVMDGVEYEIGQDLPPNYKDLFPDAENGRKYKVLYWKKKSAKRNDIFK